MIIFRVQSRERKITASELFARIRLHGGHVDELREQNGIWVVEARFTVAEEICPSCSESRARRYGGRKSSFRDCPAPDGKPVHLIAFLPRFLCGACGKRFIAQVPYLSGRGKVTQGMQEHLARAIVDYRSVRALARGEGLALATVMDALKSAVADGLAVNRGAVEEMVIRSLRIETRSYWLAISPLDLKTAIFVGDSEENLKRFVQWVAERSPQYVDLPLDTNLARLLKSVLPNAALTISAPEIFSFTEGILQTSAKRQRYQLGREGLTRERAYQLSSARSDSLSNVEQRCFDKLAGTAPFWNSYLVQDRLFSLLEAREMNYLQAMQEALRLAIAENHPMFVTAYRELSQLDQLGVTLQFDERYSIIHSKLKRLRLWMRRDGSRFEFPLFEALAGLFFVGFDRRSLPEALWQTLKEIADLMGFLALLRPSAAECSVIISAHFLTERVCATATD